MTVKKWTGAVSWREGAMVKPTATLRTRRRSPPTMNISRTILLLQVRGSSEFQAWEPDRTRGRPTRPTPTRTTPALLWLKVRVQSVSAEKYKIIFLLFWFNFLEETSKYKTIFYPPSPPLTLQAATLPTWSARLLASQGLVSPLVWWWSTNLPGTGSICSTWLWSSTVLEHSCPGTSSSTLKL